MKEEELLKQVQEESEKGIQRERYRGREDLPSGHMGVDVSKRWSLSQQMAEDPFS